MNRKNETVRSVVRGTVRRQPLLCTALVLAVAVAVMLTPTRVAGAVLRKALGEQYDRFAVLCYALPAALCYIAAYFLVRHLWGPSALQQVGVYLPLLVFEPLIIRRYRAAVPEGPARALRRGLYTTVGYLVVLLGVGHGDTRAEADKLWGKLRGLRINEDENGKTNLALADVDGEVLVVSQFTLFADCRHGRRPSFTDAGAPDVANELYEYFLTLVRQDVEHVAHGIFGADMKVDLVNDGPFTIVLDTDNL